MPQISPGDWVALVALALTSAFQVVREVRSGMNRASLAASQMAAFETKLDEFGNKFDRAFDKIDGIDGRFQKHEVDCAKDRGATTTDIAAIKNEVAATRRSIDNINAKMNLRSTFQANKAVSLPANVDEG